MNFRLLARKMRHRIRWLTPGLGVKRWVFVILAATTLLGLGLAILLAEVYRTATGVWWVELLTAVSLFSLPRLVRVLIFAGAGLGLLWWGTWQLNRALLKPFVQPGSNILDTVTAYRRRERGPRVVVIGGGTGLSTLLRGMKAHTNNLTAIVSVADDGGSSGELRRSMGILPPGDIRSCLTALADDENMMGALFKYRFSSGNGLSGHSLGNLLITALSEITGSFEEGVAESGRVLAVRGKVLPATLSDVRLVADIQLPNQVNEVRVKGESKIPAAAGRIHRMWLEPDNPPAYPPTVQAILNADLIIIGPGSLFTSIMPNLLVPDLVDALRVSRALKFFVCNVASQAGETEGYSCGDHIQAIEKHLGEHLFDLVISNNCYSGDLPSDIHFIHTEPDLLERYPVYSTDLLDKDRVWRHNSAALAQTIIDLYYERTGPLPSRDMIHFRENQDKS